MITRTFAGFAAIFALAAAAAPPQDAEVPDLAWDGWWPKGQWTAKDAPPFARAVESAGREWERIEFPGVETPWGIAGVSASLLQINDDPPIGLRFDLVWGGRMDEPGGMKAPAKGDVKAAIMAEGKAIRTPKNPDPEIHGWTVLGRGMSGDMMIEFDWLPDDMRDYWVRVKMPDRTFWFLLPYGLGSNPSQPFKAGSLQSGPPSRPESAAKGDRIVPWSRVVYNLGWLDEKGRVHAAPPRDVGAWTKDKVHVTADLSNPFDGACSLELYQETTGKWRFSRPRTTVAVGIPGGRVLFSSCVSLARAEDQMRRRDEFRFWRQPSENRTWALLRVTVEETVLERAVPSSLFLNDHGASAVRDR